MTVEYIKGRDHSKEQEELYQWAPSSIVISNALGTRIHRIIRIRTTDLAQKCILKTMHRLPHDVNLFAKILFNFVGRFLNYWECTRVERRVKANHAKSAKDGFRKVRCVHVIVCPVFRQAMALHTSEWPLDSVMHSLVLKITCLAKSLVTLIVYRGKFRSPAAPSFVSLRWQTKCREHERIIEK